MRHSQASFTDIYGEKNSCKKPLLRSDKVYRIPIMCGDTNGMFDKYLHAVF